MDKIHYSYDDITNLIKDNIHKIKDYNPDIVIAIGGGGLIPGRIIRNYINKPIYVVTLSLYQDMLVKDKVDIIQWIDLDLKDKKVLIIDEVDDTRKTLDCCIGLLKGKNHANNIGVFMLHNKIKPKLSDLDLNTITYMACEDIEDKWIVYPWDT
jgi:hypoxanthine phosphoribosyltransferase